MGTFSILVCFQCQDFSVAGWSTWSLLRHGRSCNFFLYHILICLWTKSMKEKSGEAVLLFGLVLFGLVWCPNLQLYSGSGRMPTWWEPCALLTLVQKRNVYKGRATITYDMVLNQLSIGHRGFSKVQPKSPVLLHILILLLRLSCIECFHMKLTQPRTSYPW